MAIGFLHQIPNKTSRNSCWIHSLQKIEAIFCVEVKHFNSCCCLYHQEMVEIKLGLSNMRTSHVHVGSINEPCLCGCESVCSNPPNGVVMGV